MRMWWSDKRAKSAIVAVATAVSLCAAGRVAAAVATPGTPHDDRANLAPAAAATTSFVSPHETLAAVNDGETPRRSADRSRGAYGNWPSHGTQWVQYEWPVAVTVNAAEVYWYDDGRGVRVPAAARLKYWNGSEWTDVSAASPLGLAKDTLNATSFDPVTTTRLRLEMDGRGEYSTGVMEWRVLDAGTSPAFPPVVAAGSDRTVIGGSSTRLDGHVRWTGGTADTRTVRWSVRSGPGEVTLADPTAPATNATFSKPGAYELVMDAQAGNGPTTSSVVKIRVEPLPAVADVTAVDTTRYTLDSRFWQPRLKGLIVNWIPHCIAQLEKPDLREGGIDNLRQAAAKIAGKPAKPHVGAPWANAYVLNTVEAMCVAQMLDPNGDQAIADAQQAMRSKLEEWIPLLLAAQEPDGYFQTRFTLGTPREQGHRVPHWDPRYRGEHEGYVAGYFIEAAIAHHVATGGRDRRLYDAAKRLADCWCRNLGPDPKRPWFDGHEEMELALFRLSRYVNKVEGAGKGKAYADLAKFLLDCRGRVGQDGEYDQSHLPVTLQHAAVGHAVRAAYVYTAMSDAAKATGDPAYRSAVLSLWDSLVNHKYYVTGGIGSGETSEGFGPDYSLPNNAYCESCSAVGLLFFQHRNQLLFGQAKFADLYEETIYNAILSDVDLKGENFTYTNSLDTAEARYKWHDCPCCVGNIPRALLALPTWTYATSPDSLYVNLFIGGTMSAGAVAGANLIVTQTTNYPWDGSVSIVLRPDHEARFKVRVRSPHRGVSQIYSASPSADGILSLSVNGQPVTIEEENGYAVIDRTWRPGDRIDLKLPMVVQRVRAAEQVAADRGRVALRYGPLVYNFEAADQNLDAVLPAGETLRAEWAPNLLDGVVAIRGRFADGSPAQAIPNYARNNRGGRSVVWIREK